MIKDDFIFLVNTFQDMKAEEWVDDPGQDFQDGFEHAIDQVCRSLKIYLDMHQNHLTNNSRTKIKEILREVHQQDGVFLRGQRKKYVADIEDAIELTGGISDGNE